MKTKKLMITALVALFSVVLTVNGFAAGRRQSNGTAGGSGGGLVTLDVYAGPANTSGIQANNYWADILKEDLGIQINILPQNRDLFNAMMASGELADVVIVHEYAQTIDMIKAGLLLNLDEQRAKLPNVYANIPTAIQYMKDNVSNGTGNLYALPNGVTNRSQQVGSFGYGPYIRWDLYKEQGMPVINELEDYLPLLKKMVDAHPTNEAGQRVYGFGGWTDWDGNANGATMMLASILTNLYGGETFLYMEADYVNNITRSILDDDSWYKRGLKFWFTANQMGIVDPDSINQTYSESQTKATAGRTLFSWWSWGWGDFGTQARAQQGIGFRLVPFTREKQVIPPPSYVGSSWSYQIARNAKNLDAALRFVDYMYSNDGILNLALGRKGVYWDQDSTGEPYITQLGWDIQNRAREFPNGGFAYDGLNVINSFGLATRNVHPSLRREMGTSDWIKKDFAPPDTALAADWASIMRAKSDDDLDYLRQHDMLVQKPFSPMNPPPDNILQIAVRVGQVIQPLSWQIAFARDEAEFNRLWADMVQRAKGVGIDTVNQWYADEFNRAKSSSAQYAQ